MSTRILCFTSALAGILTLTATSLGDDPTQPVPRGSLGSGVNPGQAGQPGGLPATSPLNRGIGQIVSGWTHDGIHGQELAARIHQLQGKNFDDRPSRRSRDRSDRDRFEDRRERGRDRREDRNEADRDRDRREDRRETDRDRREDRREADRDRDRGEDRKETDRDRREDRNEADRDRRQDRREGNREGPSGKGNKSPGKGRR